MSRHFNIGWKKAIVIIFIISLVWLIINISKPKTINKPHIHKVIIHLNYNSFFAVAKKLNLKILSSNKATEPLSGSFYLVTSDKSWDKVSNLLRLAECASKWSGVVHVEQVTGEAADRILRDCGPYGRQLGSFVLFGDQELIKHIEKELLNQAS